MRAFTVVERDIVVEDFERLVLDAGFESLSVGLYAGMPFLVGARAFAHELSDGALSAQAVRSFLDNHRLLVLSKAGQEQMDSRRVDALGAALEVDLLDATSARAVVTNTGPGKWLGGFRVGAVHLGVRRYDGSGMLVDYDYCRVSVVDEEVGEVMPGTTIELDVTWPELPVGSHILEFDLVSEGIAWFATGGLAPPRHVVDVGRVTRPRHR